MANLLRIDLRNFIYNCPYVQGDSLTREISHFLEMNLLRIYCESVCPIVFKIVCT